MKEKKSRVVTTDMLHNAARTYTQRRNEFERIVAQLKEDKKALDTLLKRASATTVKAYLISSVNNMHKDPNPNLENNFKPGI